MREKVCSPRLSHEIELMLLGNWLQYTLLQGGCRIIADLRGSGNGQAFETIGRVCSGSGDRSMTPPSLSGILPARLTPRRPVLTAVAPRAGA